MIGIYKVTSPSNKIYIGQSSNLEERKKQYSMYESNYKYQRRLFYSIRKYTFDLHIFEVIEECDLTELNNRERYWQEFYDSIGRNGLNCRLTKAEDKSGKVSQETRSRMSESKKGIKRRSPSAETRNKISKSNMGKKHSEETRVSMLGRISTAKEVIDITTNIVYSSAKEAALAININYKTLVGYLNGTAKVNKTSLRYKKIEDGIKVRNN